MLHYCRSETLTNKTIDLTDNTLSGTLAEFNSALSDDDFVSLTGTETLTNKTLTTCTIAQINATNFTLDASGDITFSADNPILTLLMVIQTSSLL